MDCPEPLVISVRVSEQRIMEKEIICRSYCFLQETGVVLDFETRKYKWNANFYSEILYF